ncbi:3D domain-containing protein [Algibacter sp.]|uniref:3D domain-containing protein n=1 Tax=Algibacter sp. TaxID=1872428 RepID=UPI003C710B8C
MYVLKNLLFLFVLMLFNCKNADEKLAENYIWDSMHVTSTAYNSLEYQTDSDPHITAFGDSLKPGLKYIAVSRDLRRLGLKRNTPVRIEGLEGIYLVKDKMHSKWEKRIDVYMGVDVKAAKKWGRKRVCIEFGVPKD